MLTQQKRFLSAPALLLITGLCSYAGDVPRGLVNYTEGQVELNGQRISPASPELPVIYPGETITTSLGQVEVLLTPGVFLRIGENSSLKMDAASDSQIKVELLRGEALVEVDRVARHQHLELVDQGAGAEFDRSGLFEFNTNQPNIIVFQGSLHVNDDRRRLDMRSGEELLLNEGLKRRKFDRNETDSLYAWSQKRADYASQVSEWTAEALPVLNDSPHFNDGWYWNPFYHSWAYIPRKGYVLTPFGYGIYAPQEPHTQTPVFGDFR